jgi:hypothetical protein
MTLSLTNRIGVYMLSVLLLVAAMPRTAQAGIIEMQSALAATGRAENLSRVERVLGQEQVQDRLKAMGVEKSVIDQRLAALSDAELASFAERLESSPAGGGVIEVLGVVFLVLLVLEVVGVIDIFKTVGPPR